MGSKSKYIHHSANYYAVKKAEQNEQLHIPGYQYTRIVDSMSKKPHKRRTVKFVRKG